MFRVLRFGYNYRCDNAHLKGSTYNAVGYLGIMFRCDAGRMKTSVFGLRTDVFVS